MEESDLSTGTREIRGGLEAYTFRTSTKAIATVAARGEAVLNQALCSWYLLSPRPDVRDLLSKSVKPVGPGVVEITLIIKRGHYFLLSLLHEHKTLVVEEDFVRCTCHDQVWPLIRSTLPNYGHELSESRGRLGGEDSISPDGSAEH
jgi:hypothetical protein